MVAGLQRGGSIHDVLIAGKCHAALKNHQVWRCLTEMLPHGLDVGGGGHAQFERSLVERVASGPEGLDGDGDGVTHGHASQ